MCNLCPITHLASPSQGRWPKPLEEAVKDIDFLVATAHETFEAQKKTASPGNGIRRDGDSGGEGKEVHESLLSTLRLLATALEELENDRVGWWMGDEKRRLPTSAPLSN